MFYDQPSYGHQHPTTGQQRLPTFGAVAKHPAATSSVYAGRQLGEFFHAAFKVPAPRRSHLEIDSGPKQLFLSVVGPRSHIATETLL